MLVEVSDIRTEPCGYAAKEIVGFLKGLGFRWFVPVEGGKLSPLPDDMETFDGNFVAVPEECLRELEIFIATQTFGSEKMDGSYSLGRQTNC